MINRETKPTNEMNHFICVELFSTTVLLMDTETSKPIIIAN